MAAAVAGVEPEIAAKMAQEMMAALATPPLRWPTKALAKLMIRLETPPSSMTAPATMKYGIASSGNEFMLAKMRCATTMPGVALPRITAIADETPSA